MSLKDALKSVLADLIGLALIVGGGFTLIVLKQPLVGFGFAVVGALLVVPSRVAAALATAKQYLPTFLGGGAS